MGATGIRETYTALLYELANTTMHNDFFDLIL